MPSPHTAPVDALAALGAAFSELRAQWYVFGAQAAIVWGRPRLTADIDVTVRLEPDDPEQLVRILEASGFTLRVPDAGRRRVPAPIGDRCVALRLPQPTGPA